MVTVLKSGWLFPDKMEIRAHDWTPGPSIEWRTTMSEYIGLDVSLKETAISVRRDGKRIWRGKCPSDPHLLAEVIRKRAPAAKGVVFETGPLSVWFYHALSAEGLPAICIDARHAKAALDMAPNKTDANDADGLAHLAEVGFYRAVRVKGYDSMLIRTLVAARTKLIRITTELSNQIAGS
jgi:transposase